MKIIFASNIESGVNGAKAQVALSKSNEAIVREWDAVADDLNDVIYVVTKNKNGVIELVPALHNVPVKINSDYAYSVIPKEEYKAIAVLENILKKIMY